MGQKATPGIPCNIALGKRLCQEARPDWGSAHVLLPWYLYQYYGDTDLFTQHYDHLHRWIRYVKELREDGIVLRSYGDCCPPGGNSNMECPPPLTATAFYHGTLRIMENFAKQLGKADEAAAFAKLAPETLAAFNLNFHDKAAGGYGSQTADAVALPFAIHPDRKEGAVTKSLVRGVVEQHKGHAFVVIHGGRPLYSQLCEYGYEAEASTVLKQEAWPRYTNLLKRGFTTWPEQAGETIPHEYHSGRSLNHPMQSGFAAWSHESLGGIRLTTPGFTSPSNSIATGLSPRGMRTRRPKADARRRRAGE